MARLLCDMLLRSSGKLLFLFYHSGLPSLILFINLSTPNKIEEEAECETKRRGNTESDENLAIRNGQVHSVNDIRLLRSIVAANDQKVISVAICVQGKFKRKIRNDINKTNFFKVPFYFVSSSSG